MLTRTLFISLTLLGLTTYYFLAPAINPEATLGGPPHDGYYELATNLAQGHGYVFEPNGPPVFHRPPAYPLALTPGMFLPQTLHPLYIIALNALFLTITASTLYKFATQYFTPQIATLASTLLLLNPWLLWTLKNPMATHLQLMALTLFISKAIDFTHTGKHPLTLGLLAALLSFTHATALPLILLFALITIIYKYKLLKPTLAALGMMTLTIAPWTIRNYQVTHTVLPIAGNLGFASAFGTAYWYPDTPLPSDDSLHYYGFKDYADEQAANSEFYNSLINNPLPTIKKFFLNISAFFLPILNTHNFQNLAISLYFLILLLLAARGIPQCPLAAIFIVLYIIPYCLTNIYVGHSIYTFGTLPFLALLASLGIRKAKA